MWLCGEVEACLGPGVLDGADFGVSGPERGVGRKSGGDDDAAELGSHVGEGGLGLRRVPGRGLAPVGGVGRVVSVQRVPDDDDRVAVQGERGGSLDGAASAVARLACAELLACLGESRLTALCSSLGGSMVGGSACFGFGEVVLYRAEGEHAAGGAGVLGTGVAQGGCSLCGDLGFVEAGSGVGG
jgi:hypothetical protein